MLKQVNWPLWQGKSDGKYSLEFMQKALDVLGNPEKKIPFPIHIVGTNGKGSTTAFLESILKEAGFTSHVYTSPNLVFLNERIKIAGNLIEDKAMLEGLDFIKAELKKHNLDDKISFFEGLTLFAFLEFSKHKADFSLIEAGLGGRLDATNVIDSKICILTSVSFDHTEVLGSSLIGIVKEKTSLNTKAPFVCAFQPYEEVQNYLQELEKVMIYGRDYKIKINADSSFNYASTNLSLNLKQPALKGEHQYYNASTAIKACEVLMQNHNIKIEKEAIERGLLNASWFARMQKLTYNGTSFYLDGGHNEDGVRVALEYFLKKHPNGDVICGFLSRKNLSTILPKFKGVQNLHTICIHSSEQNRSANELGDEFEKIGIKVASRNEYFYEALAKTKGQGVLILGSLYLAGEVLDFINNYGKS